MARVPAHNRPRLDAASLLRRMAAADEAAGPAPSTLPMLAAGWRRTGEPAAPEEAECAEPRPGRWWKRAALALMPLLAVALAAALWTRLPH
jgi:hypothetical protein